MNLSGQLVYHPCLTPAILQHNGKSTYPRPGHVPPPEIAGVPYDKGF